MKFISSELRINQKNRFYYYFVADMLQITQVFNYLAVLVGTWNRGCEGHVLLVVTIRLAGWTDTGSWMTIILQTETGKCNQLSLNSAAFRKGCYKYLTQSFVSSEIPNAAFSLLFLQFFLRQPFVQKERLTSVIVLDKKNKTG